MARLSQFHSGIYPEATKIALGLMGPKGGSGQIPTVASSSTLSVNIVITFLTKFTVQNFFLI